MSATLERAAAQAAAENPDGWAIDPEATLALADHLEGIEHMAGPDAALEEARRIWRVHAARFRATGSGVDAAWLLELERLGHLMRDAR